MKYLALIFFLSLSCNLFSQIEKPIKKGNVLLGGHISANFTSDRIDDNDFNDKYIFLSISPNVGYFISDNLAIGITLPINYDWSKNYFGIASSYGIGLGPYMKYYFDNGIFTEVEASYRFASSIKNESNSSYKYSIYTISPSIGYAFFINQKVSIETSLNYQYYRYIQTSEQNDFKRKNSSINLNVGFQIFL